MPAQTVTEGAFFEFELADYVTDPDGDPLLFTAEGLPAGLSIDALSGRISGTVPFGTAPGPYLVRLVVDDGAARSEATITLSVVAVGRADLSASVSVAGNPVLIGETTTFTFTVTNVSEVNVGNARLEARFSADAPFALDEPVDPICTLEGSTPSAVLLCTLSPVDAGASHAIEIAAHADQAAEITALASVSIMDEAPLDEMPENDNASVTLIVGEGFGSGPKQQLDAPGARSAAIADFDGDGFEDLAVATGSAGPLLLFLNETDPELPAKRLLPPEPMKLGEPFDAVDAAAADLDGDGAIDLLAADSEGLHRVFFNDGAGGFVLATLPGASGARTVETADYDGDGLLDLVFVGAPGASSAFRNAGGRQFDAPAPLPVSAARDVVAVDVLGDPLPELVIADDIGETYVVSWDGVAFTRPVAMGITGVGTLDAADFDGDARADLAVARLAGHVESDMIYLNMSSATPSFFPAGELGSTLTARLLPGDFDLDGFDDVIAIDSAGGHRLYKNSRAANTAFELHPQQFTSPTAVSGVQGDLNGDGRPDVAVVAEGSVLVFLNDGQGNLGRGDEAAPTLTLNGESTVTVIVGDEYVDSGAVASDAADGDLTERIVVENPVDVAVIGTYTVTYDVTDLSGNAAPTLARTVEVRARQADGGGGGGGGTGAWSLFALVAALFARHRASRGLRSRAEGSGGYQDNERCVETQSTPATPFGPAGTREQSCKERQFWRPPSSRSHARARPHPS